MPDPMPLEEQLAPRRRSDGKPIGYHRWHDLLFIHWRLPPSVLRPVVPEGLDIDTWEADAWLGVVAFTMTGVRPWWSRPVPGISAFHETNLRTYVHVGGRRPGIYFFSLDAASRLAVRVARWRWELPYFYARMNIRRDGRLIRYTSRRLWPEPRGAETGLEADIGEPLGDSRRGHPERSEASTPGEEILDCARNDDPGGDDALHAQPGTLEFFLAERYLMYIASPKRGLMCGQVRHTPYPLRSARLLQCEETLSRAAGIVARPHDAAPCHAMFSPGVKVEIFAPRPVSQSLQVDNTRQIGAAPLS
jgi:uncharacterized protein YqjF (DUF2071 family)